MRYKWLTANWGGMSPRSLAKRLRLREFTEETGDGFVVDRVRDEFIDARYIERLEYDEVTVDPFGRESSLHRVEYRQAEFRVLSGEPGLELRDAPRSNQSLLSRLSEATDFRISVSAFSVNVLDWAALIQRSRPGAFYLGSIQIADVDLADGVSASVTVKGDKDVLPSTESFVKGRKHTLDKVLLADAGGGSLKLILTRAGSAKVLGDSDEDLVHALRDGLRRLSPAD
jgi:hypothetical protein